MADDLTPQQALSPKQRRSPSPSHRHHHHRHHHHHHHHQQQQHQLDCHRQLQHEHGNHASTGKDGERQVIMIAMDGSAHSFYAFDWYMHHLHRAENEVVVAHSCPQSNNFLTHAHNLMPSVMSDDPSLMSRLAAEEEVNQIVTRIKGRLTTSGVRGKMVRLSGDPGSAIVHAAKDHKAVCIVTGSRGLGTVKRTLIGSVSDYILHHAHCPVLVCRHKETKS